MLQELTRSSAHDAQPKPDLRTKRRRVAARNYHYASSRWRSLPGPFLLHHSVPASLQLLCLPLPMLRGARLLWSKRLIRARGSSGRSQVGSGTNVKGFVTDHDMFCGRRLNERSCHGWELAGTSSQTIYCFMLCGLPAYEHLKATKFLNLC